MVRKNATIITLAALFPVSACQNKNQPEEKPESPLNIVWITCEDTGPSLPMYGDSTVRTPNLSRLAEEGIVYEQAFSVSGVCSPSRSALITGMYPASIGTHNHRSQIHMWKDIPAYEVVPPGNVKCFTEYLREAGYFCSNNHKADYNFGGGIMDVPVSSFDNHAWNATWRNREPGHPFFSIFNHGITHMFKLYKREDKPLRVDPDSVPVPPYYPDTPKARKSIARHYDNIKILDKQVGEILDKLEQDGLMDSTIIFFFSDHGNAFPRNKIWIYDSGIRFPLIVRFPDNYRAGTKENRLVSFVDMAPTVLELCNVPIPDHMQGVPFLSLDRQLPERKYIYAGKDRIDYEKDLIRAVRDKRYKYIRNYQPWKPYIQCFPWLNNIPLTQELNRLHEENELDSLQELFFRKSRPEEELYDLKNDPYELHNLADNPAYHNKLEELRQENVRQALRINDLGFTCEEELYKKWWPNGSQPVTADPVIAKKDGQYTIQCPNEAASIVYKTSRNDRFWELYHEPLEPDPGDSLITKAIRYGYAESEEVITKTE
jgi:arylsulfatase A-like enzyme